MKTKLQALKQMVCLMFEKPVWKIMLRILLGIVLVVGIPIFINWAYKYGSRHGALFITAWDAGAVLSYYGAILGSFVTVAGLFITIRFTKGQIQRESFLRIESDKWTKIETVVSNMLNEINPMPTLKQATDAGFVDPSSTIFLLQKYQMTCRTATDQLISYINTADYPKIKELVDHIAEVAEKFFQVSQKEIDQFSKQQELKQRELTLELLSKEKKYPGSLFEEDIAKYYETIHATADIHFEDIVKAIQQLNVEFIHIYEADFRELLQQKGITFEKISLQTQENADAILSLWRK